MDNLEIFSLSNGIRVVHCPVNSPISNIGLVLDVGSRDESTEESGLAHFIEHTIFKGTKKRRAYHVLNRLDSVGGEINAYTGKEDTSIHASFLTEYYARAIELISDILFNSTFPEKELEKEKEIVLDEINSYLDSPSEQIFDDFEEQIFHGHPLSNPILGSKATLQKFTRKHIIDFIQRHYTTENMVLCSAGDIKTPQLKRLLEKYFGNLLSVVRPPRKKIDFNYKPQSVKVEKHTNQAHFMIGGLAYDLYNPKRAAAGLLNNVLGGPGLNSHLNLYIREKHGIAYHLESQYTAFSDTGCMYIYLGTDMEQLNRSVKLIGRILDKLRKQSLGTMQLHQAKKQLIGHLALNQESNVNTMLNLAKSLLIFDKIESDEEVYNKIYNISSSDILEVANELLDPKNLSTLTFI